MAAAGDLGSGVFARDGDRFGRRCAGSACHDWRTRYLLAMRQKRRAQSFEIEFKHAQALLLTPHDDHQRHDRDEANQFPKHRLPLSLAVVVPAHWAQFKARGERDKGDPPVS